MKKVKFNIIDHRVFPDIRSTLKMEIQAPVVQIDGPYHSTFVITCENLGVYKSRCVFIDFHPIADQLLDNKSVPADRHISCPGYAAGSALPLRLSVLQRSGH